MMLSILGFGMVITFMYLIMSKRLSPLVALITIPIIFALIGGFAAGIDEMMLEGIKKIAPTGVMLMFAILYFGVMIDAGLFDPLVRIILRFVKGDPMKIVLGTAVLAMLISLDGDRLRWRAAAGLVPGPEGASSPGRGDPAQGRQLDGQQRVR